MSKVLAHKRHICAYGHASGCALLTDSLFISSCVYLSALIRVTVGSATVSMFASGKMLLISPQGIGKTNMFPVSSSLAFLSNLILEILLVPKYSTIGASIEYSSITVVSFFIMYYYARKFEILKFEVAKIAEIYASGLVMFVVIVALQSMSPYSPLKLLGT